MTARSSLVLEGDVTFAGKVRLDGALVIRALKGDVPTFAPAHTHTCILARLRARSRHQGAGARWRRTRHERCALSLAGRPTLSC